MIAQLRDELHTLLETIPDATVHRTVPEQIAPPCYVMQPADPFVFEPPPAPSDGLTFEEGFVIGFEIILLVDLGAENDNEQASDQLDDMLEDLLDVIAPAEWWLESMGQPGAQVTTEWLTHGQRVTVQRRTTL